MLDVACMVAGGPHAPEHASVALDALVATDSGAGNGQTGEARLGAPFQDHKTNFPARTLRELSFPVPDFDANADKSVVEKVCLRRDALDIDKSHIAGVIKPPVRTCAIGQDTDSGGLPCCTGLAPGPRCPFMECEEAECGENGFDPNNDPKDGCEDGPRDRTPDRHLPVLMGIWCCVFLCVAVARHDSKVYRSFANKVGGFRLVR